MGFLQSYLRLPRYQRILIGLVGVAIGWYGPDFMTYLFIRERAKTESSSGAHVSPAAPAQAPRTGSS